MNEEELTKLLSQQVQDGKLTLSEEEQRRMVQQFQNPEFVNLFNDFTKELSTEKGRKDADAALTQVESMAQAQEFVESEITKNQSEKNQASKRVVPKKPENLTAAEKRFRHQAEVGAKAIEKQQIEASKTKENQLKQFEQMYKQNLLKNKNTPKNQVSQQMQQQQQSQNQPEMTVADYQRLDQLLKQSEELRTLQESQKSQEQEQKLLEKLAGTSQSETKELKKIPLPFQLIYVQDVQYGDFIQEEKLNVQSARGYKAIQLRAPVPDMFIKESVKLEVEKHVIKLQLQVGDNLFILEKQTKFELNLKNPTAKMKNLNDASKSKTGCSQFIEVTVNINHDSEATVQYFLNQVKQIKCVEQGEAKMRLQEDHVEEQADIECQEKERILVSQELAKNAELYNQQGDYQQKLVEQDQNNQARQKMVEMVSKSENEQKSLQQLYKENREKLIKKVDLDSLEQGLPECTKTGISFVFRSKVFRFCNKDLVDMLE